MLVPFHPAVQMKKDIRFVSEFVGEADCAVRVGDKVSPSTVVFEGQVSEILQSVNISKELGIPVRGARDYILKTEGEIVDEGDVLARRTIAMGTAERVIRTRHDGRISLSRIDAGIVDIRAPFSDGVLAAGVHGRVSKIIPGSGTSRKIEFSVIGYTARPFAMAGDSSSARIYLLKGGTSLYRPVDVDGRVSGSIVVAGRSLSISLYESLVEAGALGIIVGGMPLTEYRAMSSPAVPICIMEGWGIIPINTVLSSLVAEYSSSYCYIDMKRKHIVVCPPEKLSEVPGGNSGDGGESFSVIPLMKGQAVQIWDRPYWGYSGTVMQVMEEEQLVQVLFPSGKKIILGSSCVVAIGEN